MALSKVEYLGDGATTDYAVTFLYLKQAHVFAKVDGIAAAFTWINPGLIRFTVAPASGAFIRIFRDTSSTARLVNYTVPGTLTDEDLNNDSLQAFYLVQESQDRATEALGQDIATGQWDAQGKRIVNGANAVDAQDFVTKADLDAAALAPVTPVAASIASTPAGNLSATNVQAALNELDSEKIANVAGSVSNSNLAANSVTNDKVVASRINPAVRQTVLSGNLDANGYANFLTTGAGLRPGLLATAKPLVLTYAAGWDSLGVAVDRADVVSADVADILGADLPASNTSFLHKTQGGAWGSTLVPPQYGYAFDRSKGALLNFEGVNNGTVFLDALGNTWARNTNVVTDTAQSKFGTASGKFLGGATDYINSTNFISHGAGSWEVSFWFRINALPAAGSNSNLFQSLNGAAGRAQIALTNVAGVTKLVLSLDSGTNTNDIGSVSGTNTVWTLAQWNKARLVFDALAGSYKIYLSLNGAAETADVSISSAAHVGALTEFRIGGLFNGWIDAFRFLPCAPKTATEVPAAIAPTISDQPVYFFSIPEMKMYEATAASGVAGTNPTLTQSNRAFVGEADTNGVVVTAVRSYALRGKYRSALTALITTPTTSVNFNTNLGVITGVTTRARAVVVSATNGASPGYELDFLAYRDTASAFYMAQAAFIKDRNNVAIVSAGTGLLAVMPDGTTVGIHASASLFKMYLEVERTW